jgi:hypothetical protein
VSHDCEQSDKACAGCLDAAVARAERAERALAFEVAAGPDFAESQANVARLEEALGTLLGILDKCSMEHRVSMACAAARAVLEEKP